MESEKQYCWNGHTICVTAAASAKYLWLDYKFDVKVDGKKSLHEQKTSLLRSTTRFKVKHHGINSYGQVVSTGFPFTPVITQATIMDDAIIGHSQMWVKNRPLTYAIVAAVLLLLGVL